MTSAIRLLAVLLLLASAAVHGLENRLADHPSPYLALHGADPVHWQPWGADVLELARKEGKLLFVSSGYFACHWCHVMHRESFRNPQIAALLNRHFIAVKVDRELEPALDAHLIDFVQRTQGSAGWPLNVFLTPEGYPLLGATYLPPDDLQNLLERLGRLWAEETDEMRDLARRALLALVTQREPNDQPVSLSPQRLRRSLLNAALQLGDEMLGGFGQQNRFPMAPQLMALVKLQSDSANSELADFLSFTKVKTTKN